MFTSNFLPFLLTAILIELTPGPNMAWIALTGASVGKRAALAATAGIALGLAVVGMAAAFGLAELAQASPQLFALLRYAGATYLLWLAWKAWVGEKELSPDAAFHNQLGAWFRHGLLLNVLNPKAAVFFFAVLPAYISSDAAVAPQTFLLSASYVAIATVIHVIIVGLAGQAHGWLSVSRRQHVIRRIFACLLAAIASWFLISTARCFS